MSEEEPKKAGVQSDGSVQDDVPETHEPPGVDLRAAGGVLVHNDDEGGIRILKDAQQRAHDAELAALASLALIRSNSDDRHRLLVTLERDQAMSPREVRRHLNTAEPGNSPPGNKK